MRRRAVFLIFAALAGLGCRGDLKDEQPLAALDEPYFRCRVQPVLTKSCGAFACHGDGRRYFKVFGRNRLRSAGTEEQRNAFMRPEEGSFNFDSARAMVDISQPDQSLLLLKPLNTKAGGYYHGALDYGASNVFINKDDPDYKTLVAWVGGAKEDPACVEPGSDL